MSYCCNQTDVNQILLDLNIDANASIAGFNETISTLLNIHFDHDLLSYLVGNTKQRMRHGHCPNMDASGRQVKISCLKGAITFAHIL